MDHARTAHPTTAQSAAPASADPVLDLPSCEDYAAWLDARREDYRQHIEDQATPRWPS